MQKNCMEQGHMNSVHVLETYFFTVHFNIGPHLRLRLRTELLHSLLSTVTPFRHYMLDPYLKFKLLSGR